MNPHRLLSQIQGRLFAPVDGASLVIFRLAFGGIIAWEVWRYFHFGWIAKYWIEPEFHFAYTGFSWVQPWQGMGMYVHMAALGLFALGVALGAFYRASATLLFLAFTYTFLLERARYLNHLYFVCLVAFLMIFVPAHRAFSMDALWRPQLRSDWVPAWSVWLLRVQLAVVYIYAGIAKLNADWFAGEPLRWWLDEQRTMPLIGPLFDWPGTFHLVAWGGLAFDLLIVPLLVWRRTRVLGFCLATAFHLMNAWFFHIGIFPWFGIAMTTLFFSPDWPRRVVARFAGGALAAVPKFATAQPPRHSALIVVMIGFYTAAQLLIPLRHWLYPGDVAWTEEGHEFSWRMKLRDKTGTAIFVVTNPKTGATRRVAPEDIMEPWQSRKIAGRPELIRQLARHLAQRFTPELGAPLEVRVESWVSLNNKPPAALVDPTVDLAKVDCEVGPASWIVPQAP